MGRPTTTHTMSVSFRPVRACPEPAACRPRGRATTSVRRPSESREAAGSAAAVPLRVRHGTAPINLDVCSGEDTLHLSSGRFPFVGFGVKGSAKPRRALGDAECGSQSFEFTLAYATDS